MAETIKIAVCDDEKNIRSYLVSLIKEQGWECGITEYASADAYLSDGKEHDLVFLDIEMGGSRRRFGLHFGGKPMSQSKFEIVNSILDIWKIAILLGIIMEYGIGLENVRDVAERYFGGVNIKVKGDVFHVTVMLQQENQDKIV